MFVERSLSMTVTCAIVAICGFVAGCGGGAGASVTTPASLPPSVERDILPASTDTQIDTAKEAHVTLNPSPNLPPANKLFVFLPGTSGIPTYYRLIVRSGAAHGFHSIGLNYPNDEAVGVTCLTEDTSCFWDVRREVITGADHSNLVSVNVANSITNRIAKLVTYLDANHPDEGWGQFVNGGTPVWSKIVIAGHSQGGGHAGVMTRLFNLSRAVYFSSPPDWSSRANAPASWTTFPSLTPTAAQFGFGNVDDTLVAYPKLTAIWQAMGLTALGAAVSVDKNTTYSGSHLLITSVPGSGNIISPTHGSTVLDTATPKDANGNPVFDSAWAYLCFQ